MTEGHIHTGECYAPAEETGEPTEPEVTEPAGSETGDVPEGDTPAAEPGTKQAGAETEITVSVQTYLSAVAALDGKEATDEDVADLLAACEAAYDALTDNAKAAIEKISPYYENTGYVAGLKEALEIIKIIKKKTPAARYRRSSSPTSPVS